MGRRSPSPEVGCAAFRLLALAIVCAAATACSSAPGSQPDTGLPASDAGRDASGADTSADGGGQPSDAATEGAGSGDAGSAAGDAIGATDAPSDGAADGSLPSDATMANPDAGSLADAAPPSDGGGDVATFDAGGDVSDAPAASDGANGPDGGPPLDGGNLGDAGPASDGGGNSDAPAGGRFEVRVGATLVPADGYSWIPVVVTGTNPDGTPATDDVTLSLSRSVAGLLKPRVFKLAASGGSSYYIPCAHDVGGCLGTVRIRVARASAPDVIVAESDAITLYVPDGIGHPAACLVAPNAFFFDGNDFIYTGVLSVTQGTFTSQVSTADYLNFEVIPTLPSQGGWWRFQFASRNLGAPLREQVYRGAQRYPFEDTGRPGIDISGNSNGCNMILGDFQIHKVVWQGGAPREVVATFDQHCEGGITSLRGCLHYTAP